MMLSLHPMWPLPPSGWALAASDVHVWLASLDQTAAYVEQLAETLTADERTRVARFYFERDRHDFIVARGLLRTILAHYLNTAPRDIRFHLGHAGKPSIQPAPQPPGIRFNLSHSGRLVLYAIARQWEVGVDIEYMSPLRDLESIAAHVFSRREQAVLHALPEEVKRQAFYACWTRKEAYIKANGDGLARGLDQFDVSLAPGEAAQLVNVEWDPGEASRWSLQDLPLIPGYAAALAIEGKEWRLSCWEWPTGPEVRSAGRCQVVGPEIQS